MITTLEFCLIWQPNLGTCSSVLLSQFLFFIERQEHGSRVDCVRKHIFRSCFHYHVENECLFAFFKRRESWGSNSCPRRKSFVSAFCLTRRMKFYFLVSREGNGGKQNSSYSRENVISYEEKKQILFWWKEGNGKKVAHIWGKQIVFLEKQIVFADERKWWRRSLCSRKVECFLSNEEEEWILFDGEKEMTRKLVVLKESRF